MGFGELVGKHQIWSCSAEYRDEKQDACLDRIVAELVRWEKDKSSVEG
jgi:hypothetical protein